jgi:hypothetical protein
VIYLRHQLHFAAMGFGDLPDDGEAKPTSSLFATGSGVAAPKPLEDPISVRRINTRSLVLDRHPNPRAIEPTSESNRAAFGGIANGIGQEIPQRLAKRQTISDNPKSGVGVMHKVNASSNSRRIELFGGFIDELRDIDWIALERQRSFTRINE